MIREELPPLRAIVGLSIALLTLPTCAALSESKLSLHLINSYSQGARQVVAAGPRVLKVLDLHEPMLEALRDYKSRYPQGVTVVRIYTRHSYPRDADPSASGRNYWETALKPALDRLAPGDRALIDYVEGPNECEPYPIWESAETARWMARFWQALAPLIAQAGFRPCISNIPVGNPPGTPDEIREKILAFAPGLLAAHKVKGSWSYHAYSLVYGTDMAQEIWTSLRYRMLHGMLVEKHPELAKMPLIITEAGIDFRGNPREDGWQARGDAAKFQDWLKWFDARLREDPYVLGATLFQSGNAEGWSSFDTEPINAWLAEWLKGTE